MKTKINNSEYIKEVKEGEHPAPLLYKNAVTEFPENPGQFLRPGYEFFLFHGNKIEN